VRRTAKIKIYSILLKAVMMCGCKPWSTTENDKVMLNTQKRKILRKYGPLPENGVWRIRTKQELRELLIW
jgi:hypothetical protein